MTKPRLISEIIWDNGLVKSNLGGKSFDLSGWVVKNYAHRKPEISTGKAEDVMKIRGITLIYRARKEINSDLFYYFMMEKTQKKVIFSPNNICREPRIVIVSSPETKIIKLQTTNDDEMFKTLRLLTLGFYPTQS